MDFKHFGVMLDCSRNAVLKPETVKKYIDLLARLGYNTLMLYTEDTYEVENQPYFGYLRGRYSIQELQEIDAYAKDKGVELIPCIQTLAHLNSIVRWREYHDCTDINDILLIGEEKTYALIEDMFKSLSQSFSSRNVHIGMDEAHMVGLGKYLQKHGYCDRSKILIEHLTRVCDIAKKYGFKPMMWSDMFFRLALGGEYFCEDAKLDKAVTSTVPKELSLMYWDYYGTDKSRYDNMIKAHKQFDNEIWFAGGLWCWNGFAPRNTFTIDTLKACMPSLAQHNIQNVIFTLWGDDGKECSDFAVLPSLYYTACMAKSITDEAKIKQGFFDEFGIKFDEFMLLDLPDTCGADLHDYKNPEKYMFYNDPFFGIFDCTVESGYTPKYDECAKKLEKFANHEEYGYLFEHYAKLCRFLQVKFTLGKRTREVYKSGDKAALELLIKDYKKAITLLREFYQAHKNTWFRENKPHGFDVQDIRMGGLERRLESCIERLEKYACGEIEKIEELEEEILNEFDEKYCYFNTYAKNSTVNVFAH